MQQQIEDLKQVQMEKQLLLKEAATRKRLLALKQQLQADSRRHSSNKLTAQEQKEVAPKTAPSETFHVTEHESSTAAQLSLSVNGKWPTRLSIKSQPSQAPPPPPSTTTSKMANSVSHDKFVKEETLLRYKQSLLLDTTTSHNTCKTDHKPEIVARMPEKTKQVTSPSIDKNEVTNANQTKPLKNQSNATVHNSKLSTKQRLAVPDTIKETEYMSAVMKQKARVSRIRQAINAAVVIQRAWRKYKQHQL